MTGLRTLLGGATRRVGVGLALAAAVVLLAPVAAATPESDADAAINQAWDAGGGATGLLGPKDGTVYAAGSGFGQNFAGGKVFFTPDTGAHIMVGAILDKYLALGGPADGDLGFPTIDEGAGKAPNSRNTTFSAADNPVIFFTPDTGARVVGARSTRRGTSSAARRARWASRPTTRCTTGTSRHRTSPAASCRGTRRPRRSRRHRRSWPISLRACRFRATRPRSSTPPAGRRAAHSARWAPPTDRQARSVPTAWCRTSQAARSSTARQTGASVVAGQVLAKYESVGGPEGDLGLPTGSEADGGLAPMSRIATFGAADKPVIFWTPDFGAVIVRGAMNAAWDKLGGATGELGAPTADQNENGDVVTQKFSGGAISWDKKTGKFSTEPANLASGLSGLEVPGQDAPQAPPAAEPSSDGGGTWYATLRRWWWIAAIPLVLIVAAIIVAVVLNRRRGSDREPLNQFDDYDDHDDRDHDDRDHDSGPVSLTDHSSVSDPSYVPVSAWSMRADDYHPDHHDDHATITTTTTAMTGPSVTRATARTITTTKTAGRPPD